MKILFFIHIFLKLARGRIAKPLKSSLSILRLIQNLETQKRKFEYVFLGKALLATKVVSTPTTPKTVFPKNLET